MRRVNDLPIRSKFIMLYLFGVLLPIAVLLVYVLTNVASEIRVRELHNAQQSLERVYSTLNTQFSGVVTLGNAVSSDQQLSNLIERQFASPVSYYSIYYGDLRPILSRYTLAYAQQVTGLTLYTDNPTVADGGSLLRITPLVQAQEWYPKDLPADAQLKVYLRQQLGQTGILQLCITRTLRTDAPFTELLRIDLNMEPVNRLIAEESSFLALYLVAPDGTAVCYPGSMQDSRITDRSVKPPVAADLSLSFGERTAMRGWKLVGDLNSEPMNRSIREATLVGLLLGAVCSLFAGAMALIFARSIALRSQRLLRHMDSMTAEHFSPITRESGQDEIGDLTEHFNAMGTRLKQLINDLYVLQLRQKSMELENVRAELKYLQAQIDPHFLFNTLNGILVLCVRNGHMEEAEIIRALSKILRRMVDTERDVVPLSEEMEFVHMVLKIEQFRFGDKLRYEFDLSDAAKLRTVPVMSVQGLVENACKHGIQSLNAQGVIRVAAWVDTEDALIVEVRDNGVGIAPDRLSSLQEQIASPADISGSIGMQNIYRRLSLHYGKAVSLTLSNAEERGTVVTIRIPAQEGV
ncbi:MAG TPA: sensor histidine kinase [Candidatus Limiplasma sp.]|mgnify:CR=1 FL=1|nr:sensor histidine kinase [Candidatus Limiplasma sp.]HPS82086.1 sensor histidine kinase [Candidatus Limiplasma sp.]